MNDKDLQDLVVHYDRTTVTNTAPEFKDLQDGDVAIDMKKIPGFEERCSLMAWVIAHQEYQKANTQPYDSFIKDVIGTIQGIQLYQKAFQTALETLDKELTPKKLLDFRAKHTKKTA